MSCDVELPLGTQGIAHPPPYSINPFLSPAVPICQASFPSTQHLELDFSDPGKSMQLI